MNIKRESYRSMKDYGLVSIITPTYNCGRFIAESIESVIAQSYGNWELVIVDDCSTDNTKEVVKKYSQNDHRIKYHRLSDNLGAAVARNTALSIAKGRWIAFLDSDDLWMPNKLERQLEFMVIHGYSFSYHKYKEMNEHGNPLDRIITGPRHINHLGMMAYCWPGCLTVMYEHTKIGTLLIPDLKKNNDYAMWLIVSKRLSCHLLNECLAFYRKRVGSISNHSYYSLIKWHYKLFRIVENFNPILAYICTINNLFWGLYKKFFYIKKHVL